MSRAAQGYAKQVCQVLHRVTDLPAAFKTVATEHILRLGVEWFACRYRPVDEVEQLIVGLAGKDGTLRARDAQTVEEHVVGSLQIDGATVAVHVVHVDDQQREYDNAEVVEYPAPCDTSFSHY